MREQTHTFEFDWWLLAIVMAICVVGLLEIYSSTHGGALHGMQWKQLTWIGIGLGGMLVLSRVDYNAILDQSPLLYLIGLGSLLLVLAVGHTRFGARRWIVVGGVVLQVSELVKLIIIIVLARYFSEVRTERLTLTDLVKLGLLVGVPAGLILLQPDLGTALVLLPVAIVGAFLAGINWKHAVGVLALGALVAVVGWNGHFLKPYQKQRLATFVHPEESPHGAGYQILQSEIAVGSGGLWGEGLGRGSQNQLGFVPVRYSDFILAALAEELGFAGVFVALVLYTALLLRLIQNAQRAKDRAGMFLVMGVAAILGFHVLVNVAMVIGFMPVTGIPLPLMSYGGSAMLFVFLALGLVMNVRLRRFVN